MGKKIYFLFFLIFSSFLGACAESGQLTAKERDGEKVHCEEIDKLFSAFKEPYIFYDQPDDFSRRVSDFLNVKVNEVVDSGFGSVFQNVVYSKKNGDWLLDDAKFIYDVYAGKAHFSTAEFMLNGECFSGYDNFYSLAKKHWGKSVYDSAIDPEFGLEQEWHHESDDENSWWVVKIQAHSQGYHLKIANTPAPSPYNE